MTDYAMAAKGIAQNAFLTGDYSPIATTLEALDTERTRADKAEQRERELREAVADVDAMLKKMDAVDSLVRFCSVSMTDVGRYNAGGEAFWEVCHWMAAIRTLIQPEPDPLVEKVAVTIKGKVREVGLPELARLIKGGAQITSMSSIVKGESL